MPVGVRELTRVNGHGVDPIGISSSRIRVNRIPTSKVGRFIRDEDQRETGSGNSNIASVVVVAGGGLDVEIVHQPTIALEETSKRLIGPGDIPKRRAFRQEVFHLDGRWGSRRLAGLSTPNREAHVTGSSAAWVRNVAEQRKFGEHPILPNRVWGVRGFPLLAARSITRDLPDFPKASARTNEA